MIILGYFSIMEKKVFFGLGIIFVFLVFVYSYFVGISIFYVVEREEFSIQTERLEEKVAPLEARYLSRSNTLTEQTATEYGFVAVVSPTYITRGALSLGNVR